MTPVLPVFFFSKHILFKGEKNRGGEDTDKSEMGRMQRLRGTHLYNWRIIPVDVNG